jgi:hypothetical protein
MPKLMAKLSLVAALIAAAERRAQHWQGAAGVRYGQRSFCLRNVHTA